MDLITYALCKKNSGGESITYTLTADTENKTIVLTPSEGTAQVITVPYATDASTVNGHEVPELENGKIPANYLPSFVDNVDEYDNISLFPVVGESNRIYIDKSTNKTYRWSGTAYVEISESIALGETSSTAYRGDRGKIAYDHSQSAHAPSNAEANQNAFSNVKIDSDIINASAKTDTLEFIAGDNIILTPNVSNKKVTVSQVPVRKTASGDIASFSDGTGDPFLEVKVNINPVQSGSGDPSPENVRPISGWSGAKVVDDAKYGGFINWNQLFPFDSDSYTLPIGLSVSITNGRMVVNGTATTSATSTIIPSRIFNMIKPINTHKYILHIDGTQNFNLFRFSIYGTTSQIIDVSAMTDKVFNCEIVNSTDAEFVASVTEGNSYSSDFTTYLVDLTQLFGPTIADYIYQLEQATAGAGVAYFRNLFPKDYYPYNAGEITTVSAVNGDVDKYSITSIPFHDSSDNITVYGGTLNVTSGELTATHANITSYNGETINEPWISSMDVYSAGATPTTGAQVVYELATPQTYQLTPTQVSTLLNQNNIFADCGQIEVAYKTPFYTDLTTKNEVQVLINESITSALNASY